MAITFEPLTAFDARAKAGFARIDNGKNLAFYIAEHRAGRCALFAVLDGSKRMGSLLLCSETKPSGEKILAVMAASIDGKVEKIIKEGLAFINAYARRTAHYTVKFYTSNTKFADRLLKAGARAKITWSPFDG